MKYRRIYFYGNLFVLLTIFFLAVPGCFLFFSPKGPLPIRYSQDILALAWDNDQSTIQDNPSAVAHFDIYYRSLGTMFWIFLQSTPDFDESATIKRIGYGNYEFAVQSVYINGKKSDFHSSSDFSAQPTGGWYLQWE